MKRTWKFFTGNATVACVVSFASTYIALNFSRPWFVVPGVILGFAALWMAVEAWRRVP